MLTTRHEYPLHLTPRQLLDRLRDPDVVARKTDVDPLADSRLLTHEPGPDKIVIRSVTRVPMDWLPSLVRDHAPAPPTVDRTETWRQDGAQRGGEQLTGDMAMTITGVNATASATMSTRPSPAGCVVELTLNLEVRVRIVGGLVERAVSAQIAGTVEREMRVLDQDPTTA